MCPTAQPPTDITDPTVAPVPIDPPDLPDIVAALGTDRFDRELLAYLHRVCGADHCAVFLYGQGTFSELASSSLDGTQRAHEQVSRYLRDEYWRRDPAILQARATMGSGEPMVVQVDLSGLPDAAMREALWPRIRDRVVVSARRRDVELTLSILRSDTQGAFTEAQIADLRSVAELLVSLIAKHADFRMRQRSLGIALSSLEEIESCMVAMTDLPRREMEVCARILYGLSSAGIALDLTVGEESVKTYRHRAYQRLGIGSERELLIRYLGLWSHWQQRLFELRTPAAAPQTLRRPPGRTG
ncbi:hypothetical protein BH10PSE18_BH10PSE18_21130 [soil metagenome]